jgi:hypothetical protein
LEVDMGARSIRGLIAAVLILPAPGRTLAGEPAAEFDGSATSVAMATPSADIAAEEHSANREPVATNPGLRLRSIDVDGKQVTEVSRGERGHALAGAALGALVLTPPLTMLMAFPNLDCEGTCKNPNKTKAAIGAAMLGAIIGAGIGSVIRTERWERWNSSGGGSRAPQISVGLAPEAGGVGGVVAVRF